MRMCSAVVPQNQDWKSTILEGTLAHLSVHEYVDYRVENCAALGQIHGNGGDHWVNVKVRV